MFNLFGSLFFGSKAQVETNDNANQITKVDSGVVEQTHSETQTEPVQDKRLTDKSASNLDWVLVDKSEDMNKSSLEVVEQSGLTFKEVGVNTSMMINNSSEQEKQGEEEHSKECVLERAEDDNDIILGSFFEKNENSNDDLDRYKTPGLEHEEEEEAPKDKDWLITPLPCLTSITASQRSIENDPLENLLIEHPSMSVFVTATSTSLTESILEPNANEMIIIMQSTDISKDEAATNGLMEKNLNVVKCKAEKRKGNQEKQEKQCNDQEKKSGKRNKKSKSPSGAHLVASGKENSQVKTMLLNNESKKAAQSTAGSKVETILLNKNQMNRSNKNSTFKSNKHVNSSKRKYHKLQQPSFFANLN